MSKWYVKESRNDTVGNGTLYADGHALWFNQDWDMLEVIAKSLNEKEIKYIAPKGEDTDWLLHKE